MGRASKKEAEGVSVKGEVSSRGLPLSCLAGKHSRDEFQSRVSLFKMSISSRASVCVPLWFL